MGYDVLEGDDDDLINYDEVCQLAMQGIKNHRMIAHLLDIPIEIIEDNKEKVDLAIEKGHATLIMSTIGQMRHAAARGDFQAQKYILQNLDDSWSDKKEVVNTERFDPAALPSLTELFKIGVEAGRDAASNNNRIEKEINKQAVDGDFEEC